MSQRKKLPIGIQTFSTIREGNYYYVDKTALAIDLVNQGKNYFLSRPRRFGKSLFLDTLKELFEGNQPIFQGLAAYEQWDWLVKYPVLKFSFGSEKFIDENGLLNILDTQLSHFEQHFGIQKQFDHANGRFADLIIQLHKKFQQPVVILVDEYDKPILDALQKPETAKANRDFLRGFYGTIKDYDAHIRFSFLTGVSKFSKVSLFSGLNNLEDITLAHHFSALCGYTDHDIDTVFSDELEGLDREEIRHWYNGYNWLGAGVYNPFDILQLFKSRVFKNYWFETGTPTFLVDLIRERNIASPNLNQLSSDEELLSSFEIENISIETLMFQSGYLTINSSQDIGDNTFFELRYPNREVYQSLNNSLLKHLVMDAGKQVKNRISLHNLLMKNDFDGLKTLFQSFYSSIPYNWYTNNDIQNYEGYYASIFYSYFASLGLDVTVEDATNLGRIDMTLQFNNQVYIFEFKVVELAPEGKALAQIKAKGYTEKFRSLAQPIHLIGVEFSKANRSVVGFDVESVVSG